MIDFSQMHWNVITYCEREDAYGKMIPAEWFILNATYATREEAEAAQAKIEEDTKGTDADWPAAYANKKIVHDNELVQYGLKPLNRPSEAKEDPCICFADGEEWEELQGHDWEQIDIFTKRCTNCGEQEFSSRL